jgi:quercetin dioxygenase-like cupin family protein
VKRSALFVLGVAVGACATAAVQSSASPPTGSEPSTGAVGRSLVVSLADAPRRVSPPGTGTVTILARGDNAFVGKLEMQPGAAVPLHRDATEEYIHVLSGGGEMTIDGRRFELDAGSTVYMPPNAEVEFRNGDAQLVAIQVFAGPEPAAKYDAWEPVR